MQFLYAGPPRRQSARGFEGCKMFHFAGIFVGKGQSDEFIGTAGLMVWTDVIATIEDGSGSVTSNSRQSGSGEEPDRIAQRRREIKSPLFGKKDRLHDHLRVRHRVTYP